MDIQSFFFFFFLNSLIKSLTNFIFLKKQDKTIERYDPMQNNWWVVRYSCLNVDE